MKSAYSYYELFYIMLIISEGNVWLGGTDWTVEGTFVWEPYGDKMNYTNFAPGEPNNLNNENCLLIDGPDHKHHQYLWDDRDCDKSESYICKQM